MGDPLWVSPNRTGTREDHLTTLRYTIWGSLSEWKWLLKGKGLRIPLISSPIMPRGASFPVGELSWKGIHLSYPAHFFQIRHWAYLAFVTPGYRPIWYRPISTLGKQANTKIVEYFSEASVIPKCFSWNSASLCLCSSKQVPSLLCDSFIILDLTSQAHWQFSRGPCPISSSLLQPSKIHQGTLPTDFPLDGRLRWGSITKWTASPEKVCGIPRPVPVIVMLYRNRVFADLVKINEIIFEWGTPQMLPIVFL